MGVRPVPIAIDDLGLIPEALDDALANWDDSARGGMRRPRVYVSLSREGLQDECKTYADLWIHRRPD